jgi:hypothetical protein
MFLQQIELTTALRPSLLPGETLLFVQDAVGLYEGCVLSPNPLVFEGITSSPHMPPIMAMILQLSPLHSFTH